MAESGILHSSCHVTFLVNGQLKGKSLLFLLRYIAVKSAGTRPFWIDVVKGAVSLAVAVPLSFYIVSTLSSEGGSRWR